MKAVEDPVDKPDKSKELSGRERQIMGLAAAGLADKNISAELGITRNTLQTYWSRIREKWGVRSRPALVAAYVNGLRDGRDKKTSPEQTSHLLSEIDDPNVLRQVAIYYATGLERAVDALTRANRTSRLLLACSKRIHSARNETSLLHSICKVLVDEGEYKMAWIGVPQHDEAKSVSSVASYGDTERYLSNVELTWADTEFGTGVVGTALRTGSTQINLDYLANPKMAPWRDEALKRGFQSSIAVPLKSGSRAFAVLAVYASDPQAFGNCETTCLQAIASQLASRILTLRKVRKAS